MWNLLTILGFSSVLGSIFTGEIKSKPDEVKLPSEILECLADAKNIVPRLTAYYNDCAKTLGYNVDELTIDQMASFNTKHLAVESCFDKSKAKDKDHETIDKCNEAVLKLSDAQKMVVAQIMWDRETPEA